MLRVRHGLRGVALSPGLAAYPFSRPRRQGACPADADASPPLG